MITGPHKKPRRPPFTSYSELTKALDAATARAEKAEAELAAMKSEFEKMFLSAAERADRNVQLVRCAAPRRAQGRNRRAEKAEAALQKIRDVMREDSNGKDPMDAVEDIIAGTKEASK